MSWGTLELREALWIIAALPGLWLWVRNGLRALATYRAASWLDSRDGRVLWARFSTSLTWVMASIEMVFVGIGVVAGLRPQPPDANPVFSWITAGALIAGSVAITWVAYRWQQVDKQLVAAAKQRRVPPTT